MKKPRLLAALLVTISLLLSYQARGQEGNSLIIDPDSDRVYVLEGLSILDNREKRLAADVILSGHADAHFVPIRGIPHILGFSRDNWPGAFWVRIRTDNRKNQDVLLVADHAVSPSLVRMVSVDPQGQILRRQNFDEKLMRTQRIFSVPPGPQTILIELRPDDFSIPVIEFLVMTPQALNGHRIESVVLAFSYGIAFALSLYNLVLALVLRTKSHWLYVAYNISLLLYFEGRYQLLAQQFGIPELPKWSLMPINSSTALFFVLFLYHIMDVPRRLPQWSWPLRLIIILLFAIGAYSFYDITTSQMALIFLLAASGLLTILLGLHALIKKIPFAPLLAISATLPGLGNLIHFSPQIFVAVFPLTFIKVAQLLAMDIEMILLSMTIGHKLHKERTWLRKKIDHGYQELKSIVYPHQVDRIWEGSPLVRTMPLGEAQAYVLVFDIVASSRMSVPDPRGFLSGIFSECYQIMMENYAKEPLQANAFRIKEMGDGFICSIGFPFQCPSPNPAEHTVELAFRFTDVFTRHWQRLDRAEALQCAIGIAKGPVEAFYPEAGVQVYELFGRAIILAHRYEATRDLLYKQLQQKGSIIILAQQVRDELSPSLRERFTQVDLRRARFTVRDDEHASYLYYWLDPRHAVDTRHESSA